MLILPDFYGSKLGCWRSDGAGTKSKSITVKHAKNKRLCCTTKYMLQGMGQHPTMCIFFLYSAFLAQGSQALTSESLARNSESPSYCKGPWTTWWRRGARSCLLSCKQLLSISLDQSGRCWKAPWERRGWIRTYLWTQGLSFPLPTDAPRGIPRVQIPPRTLPPKAVSGDSSAVSNTPCTSSAVQSMLETPLQIDQ